MTIGERIRQIRRDLALSLSEVASKADVSVATLSRIERDKQGLDFGLFLILSRILKTTPRDLVGEANEGVDPLAARIARLTHGERMQLWHDLATQRDRDEQTRAKSRKLAEEFEELMAQMEYVRSQIRRVRVRVRRRRPAPAAI